SLPTSRCSPSTSSTAVAWRCSSSVQHADRRYLLRTRGHDMAQTVAELLIDRLIGWGVDTVFGLPGDGVNGIFEALRLRQKEIRFIQVRHEEAAAFAACGYAKYTGRLGVCLATRSEERRVGKECGARWW